MAMDPVLKHERMWKTITSLERERRELSECIVALLKFAPWEVPPDLDAAKVVQVVREIRMKAASPLYATTRNGI